MHSSLPIVRYAPRYMSAYTVSCISSQRIYISPQVSSWDPSGLDMIECMVLNQPCSISMYGPCGLYRRVDVDAPCFEADSPFSMCQLQYTTTQKTSAFTKGRVSSHQVLCNRRLNTRAMGQVMAASSTCLVVSMDHGRMDELSTYASPCAPLRIIS